MFGSSTPFGKSSSSSFGSPSVLGQTSNAPNPFGSTTPFGSQTGGSIFGGTSTGVFGATQSSSPSTFIAPSSPAFGSTMSAFGASSTPAFGSSSSSFGGYIFGQKPAFGGFGSTANPFSSAFQQPQSPFGSSAFDSSTPSGALSQPTIGAVSSPAFGATTTPAFGSTPTPTFGSTGTTFGVPSAPAFGLGGGFGASNNSVFGSSSTPAFGSSGTPFGGQSTPYGAQTKASTFGSTSFGQSAFGSQHGGSRIAVYTATAEVDGGSGTQSAGKLKSILAMHVYKDKSHEELRWEDYQLGDKGGPNPAQSAGRIGFGASTTQSNPFSPSPMFGLSSPIPFATLASSNPFAPKAPASGFGASSAPSFSSSPFGTSSTANPFGTISSSTTSIFGAASAPALGTSTSPSIFSATSPPALGSSSSIFSPASAPGTTLASSSGLIFANTQSSPLFQSAPSLVQTNAAFGQTASSFLRTSAPSFSQSNISSTLSTGLAGNFFSSTPSLLSASTQIGFGQTTPSFSKGYFQPAQLAQTAGAFCNSNFGQTPAASSSFGGVTSVSGQGTFGQVSATPSTVVVQPSPIMNPFGTLPAIPQTSVGRSGSAPLIQYGISSMPVTDKPAPVRISTLLTSRHLSQGRIRLPTRKYHPKNDGQKVPFFSNDEETPSAPRADALFIPRENPRTLIICSTEQWPLRANAEKMSLLEDASTHVHGNENSAKSSIIQERTGSVKLNFKTNGVHDDHSTQKGDEFDVEALVPKLQHPDYYTEPQIQELAAKERAEPGFCCRVKDFVVGHYGYGSIKFTGETDVRKLDLESLVQFNNREVIVYMDESKKPPVGQGLNKPAEVTLLNIKCFDKKTGEQYMDGPRVDKYKEVLMKKAEDQGAEFVSYDPVRGEWKFKVQHFDQ